MPYPTVSVVLASDNRLQSLRAILTALAETSGHPVQEIVVVDRGSSDGSLEYLASADVTLVEYPGCTLAEAMNAGLAKIQAGDVLHLAEDTIPETAAWLAQLVAHRVAAPKVGVLAGRIVTPAGQHASAGRRLLSALGDCGQHVEPALGRADKYSSDPTGAGDAVDAVPHGFAYYTREALDAVGAFQECYGPGSAHEDDFCLAARCQGYEVRVHPEIVAVRHRAIITENTQLPFDDPTRLAQRSVRAHEELTQLSRDEWQQRWGWNPRFPDIPAIRRRYAETSLLWQIGEPLRFRPDSDWPGVELVIATRNNCAALQSTLESIAQTHYRELTVQVIDQDSSDGTQTMLKDSVESFPFPLQITDLPAEIGITSATNLAIAGGRAELVVCMADNLSLSEDWLELLVAGLRARPFAGAIAPMLLNPDGSVASGPRSRMYPEDTQGQWDAEDQQYCGRVANPNSSCVLYRRQAFRDTGLFDPQFNAGELDAADKHIAIQDAGYEILIDGRIEVSLQSESKSKSESQSESQSEAWTGMKQCNAIANRQKLGSKWGESVWMRIESSIDQSEEGRTLAGGITIEQGPAEPLHVETTLDIGRQERQQELVLLIASEVHCRSYHEEILTTGKQYLAAGDKRQALSVLTSLVDIAPYNTDALFWASLCFDRLAQHDRAAELAQRATVLGGTRKRDLEEFRGQFPPPSPCAVSTRFHSNQLHVLLLNLSPHGPADGRELVDTTATILRQSDIAVDVARFGTGPLEQYDIVHAFHSDDPLAMHTALNHIRRAKPDLPIVSSPQYHPHRKKSWIETSVPYLFANANGEEQLIQWLVSMADEMLSINGSTERQLDSDAYEGFERIQNTALELTDGILVYSRSEADSLRDSFGLGVRVSETAAIPSAPLRSPVGEEAFVQRYDRRDFVLFPGPINSVKNQLIGLYALAKSDLPCVVIGNFTDLGYERLCRQHARKDTLFLPELSPSLFASALAAARIVAMPSWFDVDPSLALAAMVQDCSCVVSAGGASEQALGELAYPCDPADLLSVHAAFEQAWQNHGMVGYEREQWRHANSSLNMRKLAAAELLHLYRHAIEQREGHLMSHAGGTSPSAQEDLA